MLFVYLFGGIIKNTKNKVIKVKNNGNFIDVN